MQILKRMCVRLPECLKQSGCVNLPDSEALLFYWCQETNFAKKKVYPGSLWPRKKPKDMSMTGWFHQCSIHFDKPCFYIFNCLSHTRMRLEPSSSISTPVKCSRLAMLLILLWSRKSFFTWVNCSKPSTLLRMLKDTSSCLWTSQRNQQSLDSRVRKLDLLIIMRDKAQGFLQTYSSSVRWCRFSSLRIWLS